MAIAGWSQGQRDEKHNPTYILTKSIVYSYSLYCVILSVDLWSTPGDPARQDYFFAGQVYIAP